MNDTIYNRGSEDITIDSLNVFGANSSEFTVSGVTLPFVVRAEGNMPITVCGTPSVRGLRQASLTVSGTTNGKRLNGTIGLGVFGEQVCSSVIDPLAGSPLFGTQKIVKSTDSTLCVTISNCGDLPQVYNAAVADTTNYHVRPAQSGTVLPGQTTEFCVTFTPGSTGELDSKLVVTTTNLPAMNVDLAGTGACAALTVAAPSVPVTNAGGHSTFTVTVTNSGNLDWNLGTPVLTQPDSAYRVIGPVPAIVPAGGNIQVTIGYDPSATSKTYTASLTFPNGGPCSDVDPTSNWTQTTGTDAVIETVSQSGYELGQNYPNPASQSTTFSFTTPTEANVSITLNDLTGKLVKQIISGPVSAGEHLVTLDASAIASGTYVYTLDAGGVRLSHFLVLTK